MKIFEIDKRKINLFLRVDYTESPDSTTVLRKIIDSDSYDFEVKYINKFNALPELELKIFNFKGVIEQISVIFNIHSALSGFNNDFIEFQLFKTSTVKITKNKSIYKIQKDTADVYKFTLTELPFNDFLNKSNTIPPETKISELVKNADGEFANSPINDLYKSVGNLLLDINDYDQEIITDTQRMTIEQRLMYLQGFTTIFSKAKDKVKLGFGYYDYNKKDGKPYVYISNRRKTNMEPLKEEEVFSYKDDSSENMVMFNGDIKRDKDGVLLSKNFTILRTFKMIPLTDLYLGDEIIINNVIYRIREINWSFNTKPADFYYEITVETGVNIYEQ